MTDVEQRKAATKFSEEWKGRGYEKGESQPFWLTLLRSVFGVEQPENYIKFEDKVMLDNACFIDGYIEKTHVLIEQKGLEKDLRAKIKQSDGTLLTPFQQAKRYASELPYSEHPRWIVACNFKSFLVYDMEKPKDEPKEILLENLSKEYYRLSFLVDTESVNTKKELDISLQAGEIVGELYSEILKQYKDPKSAETLRSLNMLCVRLVFCLYAEDAGIFGSRTQFHDYLKSVADKDVEDVRPALIELFKVLNQNIQNRDPYMKETLAAFPYVNGGLFDDENIVIPRFNNDILKLLLKNASEDFDWSGISPSIFGAIFESTLNPESRRSGGMHYTYINDIHKVIDPLFLNDLSEEFNQISQNTQQKARDKALKDYQKKLANLVFLDPACGSGNFLTETYISLRRLENKALKLLYKDGQIKIDTGDIIKVSIGQLYGIEINDFAVSVAKTALWIAESQMLKETENIITNYDFDYFPLKSYPNIIECNALRIDWESIVPKNELNYIIGNPPYKGKGEERSKKQTSDLLFQFESKKGVKNLDYVSAWFKKAAKMIHGTSIRVAFVSTNSISQGEQPEIFHRLIFKYAKIDFAYRTFKWHIEDKDKGKASVNCIIIGFSESYNGTRYIYDEEIEEKKSATNINSYLLDMENFFIKSKKKAICDVPKIYTGSMPNDCKGLLSKYTTKRKNDIILKNPETEKWFRKFLGANEFLSNTERWCIWLKGVSPTEISKSHFLKDILIRIRSERGKSTRETTKKLAESPYLFGEIRQPSKDYLIIPRHSSENRKYIPMSFITKDIIAGDSTLIIPDATLYHFGILSSNVHMAWVRTVCGRIKSDYRYSNEVVYNNFPWIDATNKQILEIERLAKSVLDSRKHIEDITREKGYSCSLSDMYDPLAMPSELLKAHRTLDTAVMKLYGVGKDVGEAEIVAVLMDMYKKITGEK